MAPPGIVIPIQPTGPSAGSTPLVELDDDALVLLGRAGRREAFDTLVRRHQERVLRLAHKYLADKGAAHDAAQATFVELFRSLPRYQPRGLFLVFLQRIALNQCRMYGRSRTSRARASDELAWQPEAPPPQAPDALLLAREQRREVEQALTGLSTKLREVLVLRYANDCSLEEVAQILELPVGTVKSRLFAGLAKLRQKLEEVEAP
jgi:RNA polymerase sigma-70 factor (ECF subfamily)